MKRLELLVRFSRAPNALGYCGPEKADAVFSDYLRTGTGEPAVKARLSRFEGLFPYLKLIARKNKLSPFDPRVAEAYWIGNSLLRKVSRSDLSRMILKDFPIPRSIAHELACGVPPQAVAHHSFHVFYVQSVTGRVDLSFIKTQDTCRAGWGRVVSVGTRGFVLLAPAVTRDYSLSPPRKITIGNTGRLEASKGDFIAFHWGEAALRLTARQVANLEKYTKLGLACARSTSFA